MSQPVCVDASLVIKWLAEESDSDQAVGLLAAWSKESVELIAPAFLMVELLSALRQKLVRGEMSAALAGWRAGFALEMPIRLITARSMLRRAWELAAHFDLPSCYDTCYLAVAEHERCEFWTADTQLVRRVQHELDWVRHLSDWIEE